MSAKCICKHSRIAHLHGERECMIPGCPCRVFWSRDDYDRMAQAWQTEQKEAKGAEQHEQ
jgi:hypothetical protein